jgi:hypothetical protein
MVGGPGWLAGTANKTHTQKERAGARSFILLGNSRDDYAAFFARVAFHFAHRARWAAAILRRPAADIVRFLRPPVKTDRRVPLASLRSTEIALSKFRTCPAI